MPDEETMAEAMERLEKQPEEQMIPASQVLPLLLPRRAGNLLFVAGTSGEMALNLDRVMYITGAEGGSVIRYDMEHDGRAYTEFSTQHPMSALREAMQK